MGVWIALIWAGLLGVLTCTSDPNQLLKQGKLSFHWNAHPSLAELWTTRDFHPADAGWQAMKLGHFTGFALFYFILYAGIGKKIPATGIALLYAMLTEIMQLYFSRDGRFYDMLIDAAGILIACGFTGVIGRGSGVKKFH